MTFLPLTLGIRRQSDAEKGAGNRSQQKSDTDKTLRRDDHTCRFCGFKALQYQRVIPYADTGDGLPFVTACTFCEQTLFLDRAGLMGTGVLIWLPEIGAAELNHIARAIYVAKASSNPMTESAARAYDALIARRADAKKRLGSDDSLLLATILHESLSQDEARHAVGKLEGIRVLPLDKHVMRDSKGESNKFGQIVKYWVSADGPFGKLPTAKWAEMFQTASSAAGHA